MAGRSPARLTPSAATYRPTGPGARALLYGRVSSAGQQTLEAQRAQLEEMAAGRGWHVVDVLLEVGSSRAARPLRARALDLARAGDVDLIAVCRLDRWARSTTDALATLGELAAAGVSLVSAHEAIDVASPAGRALVGVLAVFAELELDLRAERQREGIEAARARGVHLGRPARRRAWAADVARCAAAGLSQHATARELAIPRTTVRRYWPRCT